MNRKTPVSTAIEAKYMAFNHNGTPLLLKPTTKRLAEKEAAEYRYCTGNGAHVGVVT